jgi:hypothetical protein
MVYMDFVGLSFVLNSNDNSNTNNNDDNTSNDYNNSNNNINNDNDNNNDSYMFAVRRLGVHIDHLKIAR